MTPLDRYSAIPYALKGNNWLGCDCWGLNELFYREELGLDVMHFRESQYSVRALYKKVKQALSDGTWKNVTTDTWQFGDTVQMYCTLYGRFAGHCGIYIGGPKKYVMHTEEATGVVILPFETPNIKCRFAGMIRYAG